MTRRRSQPPVEPIDDVGLASRYEFDGPRPEQSSRVSPDPMSALLSAFQSLARRGVGPNAFGAPFAASPLAFLLDTMQDAVFVRRRDGTVVYKNRAAETLTPLSSEESHTHFSRDGVTYEQRRMSYQEGDRQVVIEVITRLR